MTVVVRNNNGVNTPTTRSHCRDFYVTNSYVITQLGFRRYVTNSYVITQLGFRRYVITEISGSTTMQNVLRSITEQH